MERKELINSGLDAVNTLIRYLAKDAVGSDFMNQYASTRNVQQQATERQKEILNDLISSASRMDSSTKEIQAINQDNAEGLNAISNSIANLSSSIKETEESYKKYADQFQELINETKNINNLISAIQKISSQTNLLSFNASIEAAHAGAAGAGFRIIANEVKKLSENTEKTTATMMENVAKLEKSIMKLDEETAKNTQVLNRLTNDADLALKSYSSVQQKNQNASNSIENFAMHINDNVGQINSVITTVQENEELNKETVNLFVDCASRNQMLFNDLYSFIYEIKAIFEDLNLQE